VKVEESEKPTVTGKWGIKSRTPSLNHQCSSTALVYIYENQTITSCSRWDSATYIFTDCWACRWGRKCFSAVL